MTRANARAPEGTIHFREALRRLGLDLHPSTPRAVMTAARNHGLAITHTLPYGNGFSYYVSLESLNAALQRRPAQLTPPPNMMSVKTITERVDELAARMQQTEERIDAVVNELARIGTKIDALLRIWDAEASDGK